MAHTRRLSDWQGLPLLALILIGVTPLISTAQTPTEQSTPPEAAPIVIDMAAPLDPERAPAVRTEPSALGVYRQYIESMEESSGAFASGLTEQLLGLGLNLQALERHAEAAAVLKRGVHVSRVQSGLYAADQIPLLKAEIRSLIALNQFDEVDERQRYLARVESEALEGTPASIAALLDQGAWAERAWELRLGDQEAHPEHLARSWEYYRLAYNQSAQLYGAQSMALLKSLEGMLRLQYRFADLQRARATGSAFDGSSYRQTSAMGGVYRRGEAVLMAIQGLKRANEMPAGEEAYDLARLGDWARWMGRRSDARRYYDQAWRRITPPPEPDEAPPSDVDGTGTDVIPSGTATQTDTGKTGDDAMASAETTDPGAGAAAMNGARAAESSVQTGTDTDEKTARDDSQLTLASAAETYNTEEGAVGEVADNQTDTEVVAEPEAPLAPPPVDDPVMRAALFETVTPLPDIDTLRPLPPFRRDASGPLVVQFQLNEAGKITELERIIVTSVTETEGAETGDAEPEPSAAQVEDDPAVDRLLRKMRRTRFRPRYEGGEAVGTDMIVWSFDLNTSNAGAIALQP